MFRTFVCGTVMCLIGTATWAQMVPVVEDAPKATTKLNQRTFEFVLSTLHSNRLAKHLRCDLKVRSGKDLRKFSDREEWVEYIEVDYRTPVAGGGHEMRFRFPMSSRFGRQVVNDIWAGKAEDILVEAGDQGGHWLRFKHDGRGQIVFLSMGSDLRTLPCVIRD